MLFALLLLLSGSGSTLLVLDEHDYVYPRLSPDGRRLAVAKAWVRPDGSETTEVVVVDLGTGAATPAVPRDEAEKHEVYETYVFNLEWLDDRQLLVELGDGDVGGTALTLDVTSGRILRTEYDESGDALIRTELLPLAADADRYARHFTSEEFQYSLGGAAALLPSGDVLVQRFPRGSARRPIFLITPKTHAIRGVVTLPRGLDLVTAAEAGPAVVFIAAGDGRAVAYSHAGGRTRTLASWEVTVPSPCYRIVRIPSRGLFAFVRTCTRSGPAGGRLWELAGSKAIPRFLTDDLDELSLSADGRRIAIGSWRNGKRIVTVIENWDFYEPATPPKVPQARARPAFGE